MERYLRKAGSQVFRVIVETDRIDDVAAEISQRIGEILPMGPLGGLIRRSFGALAHFASVKKIPRFRAVSFPATAKLVEELEGDPRIRMIYPDRIVRALEFPTVPRQGMYRIEEVFTSTQWTRKIIGAEEAESEGYRGEGVRVAVIDTAGVPQHSAIAHAYGMTTMPPLVTDENGHGVHVAATIGGKLYADPIMKIPTKGIAPGCELVTIKALGLVVGIGFESSILEAMDLAARLGCKVINMSLGSDEVPRSPEEDPQVKAIKKLVEENNVIPCVAAGNSGPDPGTVNSPGIAEEAITVGAYSPITGEVAGFSSRGPTPDGRIKPDCVMPGVSIYAPVVGLLDALCPPKKAVRASSLDGTSVAAPHMAGLVALMVQHARRHGVDLSARHVKEMLEAYGLPKTNDYGWGVATWGMYKRYASEVLGL